MQLTSLREELQNMVTMKNSLSAELNILRNSLFETSLEVVAHNLNHKNNSLRLFEFGKAYSSSGPGKYHESEKLCIVISGNKNEDSWKQKSVSADFYLLGKRNGGSYAEITGRYSRLHREITCNKTG